MIEPVLLATAKAQCRVIDDNSEDALITGYIKAAREYVENYTGHILVQRDLTEHFDTFGTYIEILKRPFVEVTEIGYVDSDNAPATYEDFVEVATRYPVRIYPGYDDSWPALGSYGGLTVSYTAGYEAGEEPQALIQAMLLLIAHWHGQRGAVSMDAANEVPFAVLALCDAYRAPGL